MRVSRRELLAGVVGTCVAQEGGADAVGTVMATQSAGVLGSQRSTFSSMSWTSTSRGVRPANSGRLKGAAKTFPPRHQP